MQNNQINNSVNPKITVITIVRNDVKNIEKTMRSVLDQTYQNIEYIVIDGASTDGTAHIIKKYSDRLAYWVSEKDTGMVEALNKGVGKATGVYTNFINSGDFFLTNTVFEEIFSKPHSADMLYGGFIGNFGGLKVKCLAHDDIVKKAYQGMQLCHSTLFIKTEYLRKYPFNPRYKVSMDTEFVQRCVAAGCTNEKLDEVIFEVGIPGNSSDHWLVGRIENWQIARKYFPGIKTEWYHGSHLVREVLFRVFKYLTSLVGVYQFVRMIYRKKLKNIIPLLPKDSLPYDKK